MMTILSVTILILVAAIFTAVSHQQKIRFLASLRVETVYEEKEKALLLFKQKSEDRAKLAAIFLHKLNLWGIENPKVTNLFVNHQDDTILMKLFFAATRIQEEVEWKHPLTMAICTADVNLIDKLESDKLERVRLQIEQESYFVLQEQITQELNVL